MTPWKSILGVLLLLSIGLVVTITSVIQRAPDTLKLVDVIFDVNDPSDNGHHEEDLREVVVNWDGLSPEDKWKSVADKELGELDGGHLNDNDPNHFCQEAYGFFQIKVWQEGKKVYCDDRQALPGDGRAKVKTESGGGGTNATGDTAVVAEAGKKPQEPSMVACYTNRAGHNSGSDVFCEIESAMLHGMSPVVAHCRMTPVNRKEMGMFPTFMYNTGLGHSLGSFSPTGTGQDAQPPLECERYMEVQTAAVVLRDGDANLFHMYAEFFGFYLTFDVLGLDRRDSQVLLLDGRGDGYEFAVWEALTGRPALRLSQVPARTCVRKAVYTIPGGSSPLWRGSWEAFGCSDSHLFQRFTQEIAHFYGLPPLPPSPTIFTITVISRQRRRLVNAGSLLEGLHAAMEERGIPASRFPIAEVDFELLPYAEQLRVVRGSTILVGLHGAGLTHLMFLPPEAIVVEIVPADFGSFLFRNLAKLCNKLYFRVPTAEKYGAQRALDFDYTVRPGAFTDVMLAALMAASNFGLGSGFSVAAK